MDGFDETDMAEAIARSLQDTVVSTPSGSRHSRQQPHNRVSRTASPEVIEIESDDDDIEEINPPRKNSPKYSRDGSDSEQFAADLRAAIEASKAKAAPTSHSVASTAHSSSNTPHAPPTATSSAKESAAPHARLSSTNVFLLDRAQMERERLARQKRLRPDIVASKTTHDSTSEYEDDEDDEGERGIKRQRVSHSPVPKRGAPSSSNVQVIAGSSKAGRVEGSRSGDGLFFDGELRQTANKHTEPGKDTRPVFRLTDILAPRDEISFAIVSAYVLNFPWFYSFFNRNTPVIVSTQDPSGNETIKEVLPNWIKTTPFILGGRGCQHMKFMLLFYTTGRLRVVVSTANLIEYDWRDVENTVWVQDVPLRRNAISHDTKANDFPAAFTRVLRALNIPVALLNLIKNGHENLPIRRVEELRMKWDFSKVKVVLIPSLAGKHEGWPKVVQTGHTALMTAIRDLGLRTSQDKELILECQGSSIAAYSTQWCNEFYCSARGESAEKWLDESRNRRAKLPYPPIKILFPSKKTVQESVLGEQGGGTMFCRRQQWQSTNFPRELFHDSWSKRGKVLMHSKMIVATFRESVFGSSSSNKIRALDRFDTPSEEGDDDEIVEVGPPSGKYIGWAYVGSHNFTPSAWGTLSGSSFNPVLNITNYELGILLPLRTEEELERIACWERPPRKYVLGKDEPWIQSESPFFTEE